MTTLLESLITKEQATLLLQLVYEKAIAVSDLRYLTVSLDSKLGTSDPNVSVDMEDSQLKVDVIVSKGRVSQRLHDLVLELIKVVNMKESIIADLKKEFAGDLIIGNIHFDLSSVEITVQDVNYTEEEFYYAIIISLYFIIS